jgi:hypothetical protein
MKIKFLKKNEKMKRINPKMIQMEFQFIKKIKRKKEVNEVIKLKKQMITVKKQ